MNTIINHPSLILVLVLWSIIWKGLALWKAAKKDSAPWFIVLLIVNTLGILEIIYLYLVDNKPTKKVQ